MSESPPPSDPELELLAQALRAGAVGAPRVDREALDAHERALARAFASVADDDTAAAPLEEAPATEAELAAIARGDHDDLLAALLLAETPTALAPERHERLLERALARRPVRRVNPAAWATASGLALAAAVLLALRVGSGPTAPASSADDHEALLSRSTEPLIASAAAAGTSTRVDRIAQARTGDYRKNRFRSLGAR